MRSSRVVMACAALCCATTLGAQGNETVRAARQAYDELDFEGAAQQARAALNQRLDLNDQLEAFEVLAFAYATMDSTVESIDAFKELILLDPSREPDPNIISTKITGLYALAFGQVLVVRGVRTDRATFIAGQGTVPVRFEVSRPAAVVLTALGPAGEVRIDSLTAIGAGSVPWSLLTESGDPLPPGEYQVRARATAGRDTYDNAMQVTVGHGSVDTLAHLTELEGYDPQPETEIPPRSFRPLGIAALYSALATGAALLIDNSGLGDLSGRQIVAINAASFLAGLTVSLRRPPPQPVESNIRYNRLVAEQLIRENLRIADQNAARRRQVVLTITPVPASR